MTLLCKVNIVYFFVFTLLCARVHAGVINIIVTDPESLYILHEATQDISMNKMLSSQIKILDYANIDKLLAGGESGDVLVTSERELCINLAKKGLAGSFEIGNIFYDNIYCLNNGGNMVLVLNKENNSTKMMYTMQEVASKMNANIFTMQNSDNLYQEAVQFIENGKNICGFLSMFINLNIEKQELKKTDYGVQYYACPLVGLNKDAYKILMEYYEKKLNS